MAPAISDHEFNDDLLLAEPDRKLAACLYPTILHVLDHPELRQLFSEYDELANRSKRKGRAAGFWVIAFGFSALAIAALEYPLTHATGDHFSDSTIATVRLILAALSAVCGIASVLIGSVGVLYARRKRDWLHLRLMGESIRQFHFQTLVFRLPEILASLKDDNAKSAFVLDRKLWFKALKSRFEGKLDAVFGAITNEQNGIDPWLHEGLMKHPKLRETRDLAPLFDAYRKLRILHQLGYADYKLQPDHRIFSPVPRRQAEVISQISSLSIILLCAISVCLLLGVIFPTSVWAAFDSETINVVVIWIALAALATRAIEQGLQPEREAERYQQYRSGVRAILEQFDAAASQDDKIRIMRDMERLAFDEMRNFLITNERARFVM
jgi:hypothetical protein